jgi:glycosyl-4,4'-diaponeurosporenoate acyltransferase
MMDPAGWSVPAAIAWFSGAWLAIGLVTGWVGHRLPLRLVSRDTWLTRLRARERGGRVYERRLRISRWKDSLPEAGALFRGGFSKRHVLDRSTGHLVRFTAETRRAEYVHWMHIAAASLFFVFVPAWLAALMVVFALLVHLPFVAIQRYNRARLLRTLARRGIRGEGPLALPEATPAAGRMRGADGPDTVVVGMGLGTGGGSGRGGPGPGPAGRGATRR